MNTDHSKIEVNQAGQITAWCSNNGQGRIAHEEQPTPTECYAYGRYLMWRKLFPEMSPAKIARRANDHPNVFPIAYDSHPIVRENLNHRSPSEET